ncbi:MAG TPA: hypothetical protein VFA83_09325 [Acidimicrobiales bacterium]|nr:hypothetical protein [Acidimicrobiales bacterium]
MAMAAVIRQAAAIARAVRATAPVSTGSRPRLKRVYRPGVTVGRVVRVVRWIVGGVGIGAAAISVLVSAETTLPSADRITIDCGEPAVLVAIRGSHINRDGSTTEARHECKLASNDQTFGGAIFGVVGIAVLLSPAVHRRFRRAGHPPPVPTGVGEQPALHDTQLAADPGWEAIFLRQPGTPPGRKMDNLALIRTTFFASGIGWIMVAAWAVAATMRDDVAVASGTALLAVLVAGLVGVALASIVETGLDCGDDGRLAKSYVRRFFVKFAIAQVPAVAGIAGSLATGSPWTFLLGLLFGATAYARIAPTSRRIEQDQRDLMMTGCSRSLFAALRGTQSFTSSSG